MECFSSEAIARVLQAARALALLATFGPPAPGHADVPQPIGPAFRVNTDGRGPQIQPRVAMNASGEAVFVWINKVGNFHTINPGVRGRHYAADGAPRGDEFTVNSLASSLFLNPRVAISDAGTFVVAWTSQDSTGDDADGTSVQARRFTAAGVPLSDQFQVNTTTYGNQSADSVATRPDGNRFVIGFADTSGLAQIYQMIFIPFVVIAPASDELNPDSMGKGAEIAMDVSGEFVAMSERSSGLWARLFTADGTPRGDSFVVDSSTGGEAAGRAVAMDGAGNFVVVWERLISDSTTGAEEMSIRGRLFEADGTPHGSEISIADFSHPFYSAPRGVSVAMNASGQFVVAWSNHSLVVEARLYQSDGAPAGGPVAVGNGADPSVAIDAEGDFLVAYVDREDPLDDDIVARRYTVPEPARAPLALTAVAALVSLSARRTRPGSRGRVNRPGFAGGSIS